MFIESLNFNIQQIAESGQCFRFSPIGDDSYRAIAFSSCLDITQNGKIIELSCDENEWERQWKSYFDMDTDYSAIGEMINESKDEYLIEAYNFGSGIRILRQDLWEVIISFMISQNNNIPRIKSSVEKICRKAGILVPGCIDAYAFPYPTQVDPEIFMDKSLGLGYRDEYLRDIYIWTANNPKWLGELKKMTYEEAMAELLKIRGIGRKVANCICLFGLHHVEAFPIDTHIKQIINEHYPCGFNPDNYPGVAGIVQQYMFYYHLNS